MRPPTFAVSFRFRCRASCRGLGLLALALTLASACAHQPDPLFEAFQTPDNTARPFVRWWWNGGRVDGQEIVRELDVMQAAGIGGVEINTIAMREGASAESLAAHPSISWLSPQWNTMVATAARAAKERHMTADLIVGSGWPFGGQFLTPEEQTTRIKVVSQTLTGPRVFTSTAGQLAQPPVEGKDKERAEIVPSKSELVFLRLVAVADLKGPYTPGIDVLPALAPDGEVSLQIPKGEHILLAGTRQSGFSHVTLGAPGADGPVVNHFDATAVRKYLDHMSAHLSPTFQGNIGSAIRAMFVDSLELDHANWTGDFAQEFKKRRGYAVEEYLPLVLADHDAGMSDAFKDIVQRARYDFNKTLVELFDERFVKTFVAWAEAHNVKARMQAYGRETHPLHGSMSVHLPEGETWLWLDKVHPERIRVESTAVNKYVSSAANLTGQRLRSFEAMTNAVPVFRATLQDFKRGMDATVLSGLNHPIIHGFNYNPPDAGFPGWVRFGCYLNEKNPWWPHFRRFSDYAARVGTVMRKSDAQAHIAVLAPRPEEWAQHGLLYQPFPEVHHPFYQYKLIEALHQAGYNVDFISEKILTEGQNISGQLRFGPRAYDLILMQDVGAMEVDAANALANYASEGGHVIFIGQTPTRAPGLHEADKQDRRVSDSMRRLMNAPVEQIHKINAPIQTGDASDKDQQAALLGYVRTMMASMGGKPDVVFDQPRAQISQVFHRDENRNIYFIANSDVDTGVNLRARFTEAVGTPYRWNPHDGTRQALALNQHQEVSLNLGPVESALIVFEPDEAPKLVATAPRAGPGTSVLTLVGPWEVELIAAPNHEVTEKKLPQLVDLSLQSDDKDLAAFAGVAVYRKTFESPGDVTLLDLGEVHDISQVTLNGKPIGVRWWGSHTYDVSGVLSGGTNTLEIRVTTVLANMLKHMTDNPMAQGWVSWAPPIPMGLLGPVQLRKQAAPP